MTRTLTRRPARSTSATDTDDAHEHRENYPWGVRIVDHPKRKDSKEFEAAKKVAKKILATLGPDEWPYGPGPWQMHHAASHWVLTRAGWRMYRGRAGIEWSMQFCADPAKVDRLRQDALLLVEAFPATLPALADMGYEEAEAVLKKPIQTAKDVQRWTDSLFNACVPMDQANHQGILPGVPGEHHYPWPVKSADFIRYDDFPLWITLEDGTHAAVTLLHARGSGDGHLRLVFGRHGSIAGNLVAEAQQKGKMAVLPPDSPIALAAFREQIPRGSKTASVPLATRSRRGTRRTAR